MEKLTPAIKEYIWGGNKLETLFGRRNGGNKIAETWEVSAHKDGESKLNDGTLLSELLKRNSQDLSFFIKYIDATDNLSIQVHPNDEYAKEHENSLGKTEFWYIISADEGAGIYCGFKEDTNRDEFLRHVTAGDVETLCNFIPVKAGDGFLIKAGTVHAIGKGCVICEIQQNSNITYRVYDYNRTDKNGNKRELHLEKALDVINFNKFRDETNGGEVKVFPAYRERKLTECEYFTCREIRLNGSYEYKNDFSPVSVNVISGNGTIDGKPYSAGDSFLALKGEKISIDGSGVLIMSEIPTKKYYAGIDLGGTFIKCGIVSNTGEVISKTKIPTGRERHYSKITSDMANMVTKLAKETGVEISGVGIGSPGTIDSEKGVIVYSNNIAWENVPLAKEIEKALNLPTYITNDANAAALGESFAGAGKEYKDSVLITLGTGVGGGVVIGGKLFEGYKSAGAELGHHVIERNGRPCTCGRLGCFEAYASATALIKRANEMKNDSAAFKTRKDINAKTIFDDAKAGDAVANKLLCEYFDYLAEGIANIINIFRPEAVLIGGGLSAEGDYITKPITERVNKLVYGGTGYAPVAIKAAILGNDAGLIGAARLAMN